MKQLPAIRSSSPPGTPLLYRLVFERAFVRFFVVIIIASFFLQTVERAFASEAVETPEPNLPATITDETVATIQHEITERIEAPPEQTTNTEQTPPAVTPVEPVDPIPADVVPAPETQSATETSPVIESMPILADTITSESTSTAVLLSQNEATTSTSTAELSTTTDSTTPTLTVESDQMIQFSKENCLAVEDGSYYCQIATTTPSTEEQGLFSLPDADGDLEIYIKNADGLKQITFNTVDDASPQFDPASDSLVWHRLVNERYQIVVYDLASGEERQLTDTSTNNMEPFRADNLIVWQYWDNDAWQIMLYDGDKATQLTNTVEHNLAPVIRNNLVVWHRIQYNEKTIEVYDMSSGSFMTIRDDNGGTISNPRMVLVYDAAMENGDVETRGYDLVTGEITSFAAEPASLPEEIPEPDTTGETRALLTSKSSNEDEVLNDALPNNQNASGTPPLPNLDMSSLSNATTTSSSLELDLTTATTTVLLDTSSTQPIPDLVVSPYSGDASPVAIPVVE